MMQLVVGSGKKCRDLFDSGNIAGYETNLVNFSLCQFDVYDGTPQATIAF